MARRIGGNATLLLQRRSTKSNAIGEQEEKWVTGDSLLGWLDLMSGDSSRMTFNAKTQDSTHVFLADYQEIDSYASNARAIVGRDVFDVLLIDDPMGRHEQLELYLRHTGGRV